MNESKGPGDKGATEDEVQRIEEVQGDEAMGYAGGAREEHSGEDGPREEGGRADDRAENENAP